MMADEGQDSLRRDARRLVESFQPAFDAMANAVRTLARTLSSIDLEPFANALWGIEQAEAKNGSREEDADE
jgi:hypothetical protein